MMHIVQRFLSGILVTLLLTCPQVLFANEHANKKILLLNSYHEDMPWSKKFHSGFKKQLQGTSNL